MRKRTRLPAAAVSIPTLGPDMLRLVASFLRARELEHFSSASLATHSALLHDLAWPIWLRVLIRMGLLHLVVATQSEDPPWHRFPAGPVEESLDLRRCTQRARNRLMFLTRSNCQLCTGERSQIYWHLRLRLCSNCCVGPALASTNASPTQTTQKETNIFMKI